MTPELREELTTLWSAIDALAVLAGNTETPTAVRHPENVQGDKNTEHVQSCLSDIMKTAHQRLLS